MDALDGDALARLARENDKLRRINEVLMRRVEQATDEAGSGYAEFETAVTIDGRVRARTRDLEEALDLLHVTNARLSAAMREVERANTDLTTALEAFEEGFALFDGEDRLLRKNSRFAAFAPDVAARIVPGIGFGDYVALIASSLYLVLPPGHDRDSWREARIEAHRRRSVNFNAQVSGDRWVQVSEHRTAEGATTVLQTDVTDIIRAEREERDKRLDRQARMVRATLDHIEQGVAVFDGRGVLAACNTRFGELVAAPARLMRRGTGRERVLACLSGAFGGDDAGDVARLVAWIDAPTPRRPLRGTLSGPDGRVLALHAAEMPDGSTVLSLGDITAERAAADAMAALNGTLEARVAERMADAQAAREAAERANAGKTRFVAAVSHDLLQPLSAAKLFTASLAEEPLEPSARALADRIQRALGSVEELLGGLLDICRLDASAVAPSLAEVPLGRLFQGLRHDFAEMARQKGLELRVIDTSAVVVSDPAYLRRILQNLVSNAIRYTATGKVVLGVKRDAEAARIVVGDTGCGIAEADQGAVFEEFRRLDRPATARAAGRGAGQGTRDGAGDGAGDRAGQGAGHGGAQSTGPGAPVPGMGLGLAIVERACRLLNHGLTLHSTEGVGTVFTVSVPLVGQAWGRAGPGAGETGARPGTPASLEGMIVLLVEDDAAVREAMTSLIEGWGASLLVAANAAEARALVGDLGLMPDAVIADHHLGAGSSGLELIAEMRADDPGFLGVLTTFDRDPGLREVAAAASLFVRYKPVDPAALAALLARRRPGC
ncbi:MAG: PAS-domain containing protein [Pseudomonadota bacterium]